MMKKRLCAGCLSFLAAFSLAHPLFGKQLMEVDAGNTSYYNETKKRETIRDAFSVADKNDLWQATWQVPYGHRSEDIRPWTFWYWMYGAVSAEGITADLEAMREIGLGGAYLMPIRGTAEGKAYGGTAQQLSPRFWELVKHSMQEADRLGLKLGMHICDGFALAGGPWITPEESMQKVVWSDTVVVGGNLKNVQLPLPDNYQGYYEDIATYIIPLDKQPENTHLVPTVTVESLAEGKDIDASKTVNRDAAGVVRSSYPCRIQYEYPSPVTCSNVEIILSGNNYQAHRLKVLVSEDGRDYRLLKQLVPARHGWQNTDSHSTHALPPVTARFFRFEWTPQGSEPGSEDLDAAKWRPNLKIKDIVLHTAPRVHQWEGKAGLVWRVAEATSKAEVADEHCVSLAELRRVILNDGRLNIRLPKGKWRILRMGHTSTGHTNATAGGGKGLECDKFDAKTVRKQFDHWFAKAFYDTDPELARRVLKYMHVDSWECGTQNWSKNFAEAFSRRYGYDLLSYLPVIAGIPIETAGRSEQVLRDVRVLMGELVSSVFYTTLADCAREYGCRFSAECVAPTMVADGMMHYREVDLPMGEFWLNSPTHDKPNDMLDAISGAHIYGKNIVQAEGFTELRGVWDEDPAMLKPLLDRNYALGFNKLFFHVNTHNPWLDRKPGMTLDGIGLFFQRDQTWWREGKAFIDYITRCQMLLQYGRHVADIAVFTGEEMPRRAILPERLVSMLPGIYGAERVESERLRLANEGQPIRVRPVGVSHSANMADPETWINPLRGYAYDSFNKDALLRLAKTENGRIVLPGGTSYKVLVLPTAHPMNPDNLPLSDEVSSKVKEMREAGVLIPELPYMADDFSYYGLDRDVILPANVAYTHRSGEEYEVYFVANQMSEARTFTASFRVNGRIPQLWDAVSGTVSLPVHWKTVGKRTEVTLSLPAYGAIFVVFPAKGAVSSERKEAVIYNVEKHILLPHTKEQRTDIGVKEWTVLFHETGNTLMRPMLFDWSKEEDEKVKYYSGRATYSTSFAWKALSAGRRVVLSLGSLSNVAMVRVNGVECGIAWTAPYEVDITESVAQGLNKLEIDITNTWANALRGADKGKAPFPGIWTNAKYRLPGDMLLPAGLMGPVELIERY